MAVVIFIILFALFACLNGDSSGVEAIAKIIGGVVLFIVVGSIIVFMIDNPAIIIGIIVLAVLAAIVYSLTKENNSKSTRYYQEAKEDYNTYNRTYYEEKTESLSDFQKELQQNSKSQLQIKTEEYEKLKSSIETEYSVIKIKINKMAENAQYTFENGKKTIVIDYKSYILDSLISKRNQTVYLNKSLLKPS